MALTMFRTTHCVSVWCSKTKEYSALINLFSSSTIPNTLESSEADTRTWKSLSKAFSWLNEDPVLSIFFHCWRCWLPELVLACQRATLRSEEYGKPGMLGSLFTVLVQEAAGVTLLALLALQCAVGAGAPETRASNSPSRDRSVFCCYLLSVLSCHQLMDLKEIGLCPSYSPSCRLCASAIVRRTELMMPENLFQLAVKPSEGNIDDRRGGDIYFNPFTHHHHWWKSEEEEE